MLLSLPLFPEMWNNFDISLFSPKQERAVGFAKFSISAAGGRDVDGFQH